MAYALIATAPDGRRVPVTLDRVPTAADWYVFAAHIAAVESGALPVPARGIATEQEEAADREEDFAVDEYGPLTPGEAYFGRDYRDHDPC